MSADSLTQAIPAIERLARRTEPQPNGCWFFTGYINADGYGRMGFNGERSVPAYRVAYTLHVGPIPDGMAIDHTCHTNDPTCTDSSTCLHRRCVNPAHLQPVTTAENNRRGNNTRKTSCVHGHDYTDENTYRSSGKRYCITCWTARTGYTPKPRVAS